MKKLLAILSAVAVTVALTVPALAADWSFYGSSRMATFWEDYNFGKNLAGGGGDEDLYWQQQGNSRIGANVKAGPVSGRFEYGTGVDLRILWAEWQFSEGANLGVGHDYVPLNLFLSNQVWGGDTNMLDMGGVYGGRYDMLQLQMGNFKFAALENNRAGLAGYNTADCDSSIPKLEANYVLRAGGLRLEMAGGYQTYDAVNSLDDEESVDSYVLGLGVNFGVGPFNLWGDIYMAQNPTNYGLYTLPGSGSAAYIGGKAVDSDAFGWLIGATFKMSDIIAFEAGYGYTESELDMSNVDKNDAQSYYIQAVINLAKGVSLVPEFGVRDYMNNASKVDEGDLTYFGAKWQINF